MSKRDRIVIVVGIVCWLLILGAVFLFGETHCAVYLTKLLDTTNDCVSTPSRPRASDVETFRWKGHDYMMLNRGNELSIFNVDNPAAPILKAESFFRFGTRGDSDYDLIDFDVTDEGRFMVLSHKVKRTVIVDLGTGATPAFPANQWSFYDGTDSKIGGYVFVKDGQEYLIAALYGGCAVGSGLYTLDSTAAPISLGCVQIGATEMLVKGLHEYESGGELYLYAGSLAGTAQVFRADGAGASLTLAHVASPAGMWGRRYELSIDDKRALLASTNFTLSEIQVWDVATPAAPVRLWTFEGQASNVSLRSASAAGPSTLMINANGWPNSTRTFHVSDTGVEEFEHSWWTDLSLPHNQLPVCAFASGGALSKNGNVLFLSRYAIHQVYGLGGCLPTPTPTPTPIPNEIFADSFESGDASNWSTPTPTP